MACRRFRRSVVAELLGHRAGAIPGSQMPFWAGGAPGSSLSGEGLVLLPLWGELPV